MLHLLCYPKHCKLESSTIVAVRFAEGIISQMEYRAEALKVLFPSKAGKGTGLGEWDSSSRRVMKSRKPHHA